MSSPPRSLCLCIIIILSLFFYYYFHFLLFFAPNIEHLLCQLYNLFIYQLLSVFWCLVFTLQFCELLP